jgi:aminoglycoside 6'-N-acetyltransferase
VGFRLHGRLTSIRPATDEDADLLVRWHADPDVSRYWDDETFTRDALLDRLAREHVDPFVVEADGEPVGYLQAWREEDEPLRGGIDMFLIPEARGRGLGPDAGRTLARHLHEDRGFTRVTVDPYSWNERAIRAWRRAGFVDVETRPADDDHRSEYLLMEWSET